MAYPFENQKFNSNVKTGNLFRIHGMQDYYLGVTFRYTAKTWNGAIPIKSKYQGTDIPLTLDDVKSWTLQCYTELDPGKIRFGKMSSVNFGKIGKHLTHRRCLMH